MKACLACGESFEHEMESVVLCDRCGDGDGDSDVDRDDIARMVAARFEARVKELEEKIEILNDETRECP